MEKAFVYTEDMTVGYDGKPLIKDIQIRVDQGEILTLIGPNGAGKSTILKSMTKQLQLLGGTVYLGQKEIRSMSGKDMAKKLSVVMTQRLRTELMTCWDVVATGRYPYTGTLGILGENDKQKVLEALEMVHGQELADKDFTAISDGQRQRILLARAICQEPEVIVLDEPTSFLDIRHKLELLNILKKMVLENHLAVIMSLHELVLAQKVSDKIVCVNGDTIERYGTPEEIFTQDYISHLYNLTSGSFNAHFGCMEMAPPKGKAQVFVIAGNGTGISVFRKLQRLGIPFATGVLHRNDVDFEVARALAQEMVVEEPFEPISETHYQQAKKILAECESVICCVDVFGTMNAGNRRLLEEAEHMGKKISEASGIDINTGSVYDRK